MRNLTEANLTDAVVSKVNADDPRTQQILASFVKHIHAFVQDIEPTEEEWWTAVQFLTETGQICTKTRQEYILLSDMLGITTRLDFINNRVSEGITETTVTGPFHSSDSNEYENGAIIANGPEWDRGEYTLVKGRVLDPAGNPIAGAKLDIWQSDDIGAYDVQDEKQPDINLRGIFTTNENGEYWFRTIKPWSYPVPTDGPVGRMLGAMDRHPMRPAHIHFIVSAEGFRHVVTHIFVEGDQYLDSDAAFGVRESLIVNFEKTESEEKAKEYGLPDTSFYEVTFDFVLDTE